MRTALNLPIVFTDGFGFAESLPLIRRNLIGHIPYLLFRKCGGKSDVPVSQVNVACIVRKNIGTTAFTGSFIQAPIGCKAFPLFGTGKEQCRSFDAFPIPSIQPDGSKFAIL
ncbi:hypothetical protein D3C86_1800960 [compost metagenome]